jgi:Fur family ferric uptake transcriptional regulator
MSVSIQRNTRQREILRRLIAEAPGPLSVQELLGSAQSELPALGIATVYRTLKLLEEAKEIRAVVLPGGESRWEPSDRGHHHHFQCRACTRVIDFLGCPLHVHSDTLPNGFVVETHEVTLIGLCPDCSAPPARKAPVRKKV